MCGGRPANMFSVSSLFMDFESTDLMRFDPAHSDAGEAGDPGLQSLVLFMSFYLKNLAAAGSPYILGYALAPGASTTYPPGEAVPDELAPVGTTYTMYHDPVHQGLSTLNFVLATKKGHGKIAGTPGNFDSNWINPTEQCDAKMIYSHSCLLEPFVLQPLYETLAQSVFDKIKDHLSVTQGNNYATGRASVPTGLSYTISNVTSGEDQYVNTFTATLTTEPAPVEAGDGTVQNDGASGDGTSGDETPTTTTPASSAVIGLNGTISFYKEVHRTWVSAMPRPMPHSPKAGARRSR
jgi:hypothetical protein